MLASVALPSSWQKNWQEWLDQDESLEKNSAEKNFAGTQTKISELDKRQNLLLDTFLDGVVDGEMFKTKKNEIFEQKLKFQEELSKIRSSGASWLEPMREFVNTASELGKVARAKNSSEVLRNFAQKVGSNYFLHNRRLGTSFKEPFAALRAHVLARRTADSRSVFSSSAGVEGVGPSLAVLETAVLPLNDTPKIT